MIDLEIGTIAQVDIIEIDDTGSPIERETIAVNQTVHLDIGEI
jgi:hypothetical protein